MSFSLADGVTGSLAHLVVETLPPPPLSFPLSLFLPSVIPTIAPKFLGAFVSRELMVGRRLFPSARLRPRVPFIAGSSLSLAPFGTVPLHNCEFRSAGGGWENQRSFSARSVRIRVLPASYANTSTKIESAGETRKIRPIRRTVRLPLGLSYSRGCLVFARRRPCASRSTDFVRARITLR